MRTQLFIFFALLRICAASQERVLLRFSWSDVRFTNSGEGLNCHHTANVENDEVQITSHEILIVGGILQDGDLMEAIADSAPDMIMLRSPFTVLTPEQISIIAQRMQQGEQDNSCEPTASDALAVTCSGTIAPILQARCASCHRRSNPSGGLNVTQWSVVGTVAAKGTLQGAVRRLGDPWVPMPPSGPILSDCRIRQLHLGGAHGALYN